tara:strand:- start:431 stop:580 length:150 start_codon:yes stop_codon:yes gene_type:complete
MSKWRVQTPKEIEAEIEKQKIKALEEKLTIAVNKMLNKHAKKKRGKDGS